MSEVPTPFPFDADTLTGDMRPIRRAVLSIGSNLGDRMASLQGAVDALMDTPELFVTGVSSVYETAPLHCPPDAGPFLNAVVLADTTMPARRLLERAHAIEEAFGRVRMGLNSSRTLDVDLIQVGERRRADDFLTLPHPRAFERAFVLVPWLEVEPSALLVDAGPVAELVAALSQDDIVRRDDLTLSLG